MILTDIYIPAIDGNYDFMLDENAQLTQLIAEISEMISKKVNEAKLEQMAERGSVGRASISDQLKAGKAAAEQAKAERSPKEKTSRGAER